jgi:hypothetical protein
MTTGPLPGVVLAAAKTHDDARPWEFDVHGVENGDRPPGRLHFRKI